MSDMNAPRLPESLAVSDGPWAGTYAGPYPNENGTSSYYGPEPDGTVKESPYSSKEYELPALHFTLDPTRPGFWPHASLNLGDEKNAHMHWNDGQWSLDVRALDSEKRRWVDAVEATHPNAFYNALAEIAEHAARPYDYEWQKAKYEDDESAYFAPEENLDWSSSATAPGGTYEKIYLDEQAGDVWSFTGGDWNLTIDRYVLEEAADGQRPLPDSDKWVTVCWGSREVPLPVTLFDQG